MEPAKTGAPDSSLRVTYEDALAVIRRLLEACVAKGEPAASPVVLLGGTAMAAWGIRSLSRDVDLYTPEISDEIVHEVEDELRDLHGPRFRLDVTTGENLWGVILVRDLACAPKVGTMAIGEREYELKALSIEDLFLLKLSSGRAQDLEDLPLLAARTTPAALLARFHVLAAWHGDRRALMGYADAFVAELARLYGMDPLPLIEQMTIPEYVKAALREAYCTEGEADDGR